MHYRSAEALNKFSKGFELEHKPLFRSTKHLKYMATAAVFELIAAPDDLGW